MQSIIFAIVIGYLLGSINPAFILGEILRGVDIRKKGTQNAGAMNAFKTLGFFPGIVTLFYDLGKGVFAMLIVYWSFYGSLQHFETNILFLIPAYIAGLSAIVGHNWPFYLKFKGGKGAATTSGLLLFLMTLLSIKTAPNVWPIFIVVCIIELLIFIIFKDLSILGFSAAPLLLLLTIKYCPFSILRIFLIIVISIIIWLSLLRLTEIKHKKIEIKFWRKILRLAAIIFLIFYFFFSKTQTLLFAGIVLCIILIPEIVRLTAPKAILSKFWLRIFFKKNEEKMKISAITWFLISTFLIILLFEKNIAIAAILIMLFGDLAAGIFGRLFGKHVLVKETGKTLEGSIAFFWACLVSSLVLTYFININIYLLLIASLFAALAELYSCEIDDNLTVGIIAALAMTAFRNFI